MNNLDNVLKFSEEATFKLRAIYESRGYSHYKMSKFEEYDLYAGNKDFLMSGNVITFTDMNGRLMALKPDVTMSIIKNSTCEKGGLEKVYYNENVYRVGKSGLFKEIMQTGLECLGEIDLVSVCEVISLAAQSLAVFSDEYVLDISHMGILTGFIDETALNDEAKRELIGYIGQKSVHAVKEVAAAYDLAQKSVNKLVALCEIGGDFVTSLKKLEPLCESEQTIKALYELKTIYEVVSAMNVSLDFSVVQDMSYYNGIVFQGFIKGIPENILSGGQYDKLVKRMGKKQGAIGFGIETDLLERLPKNNKKENDGIAIIYKSGDDAKLLNECANKLRADGKRVLLVKNLPENRSFEAVYYFVNGGLEEIE
ncbi:MAG: ATP phosphoribosyltransferase regulatory subunit [Oscillospiraceae bacterium]|nr:ATP phosphoribosyltransferase regulatory subunit [Oscillospiraceae bacterium]